jgi:hypothetical protein
MSDSNIVDLVDVDCAILAARLGGVSIRRLSKQFQLSEREILRSLDRSLPPMSAETRMRLFREDVARLDELLQTYWPAARTGSSSAAQICLRLLERRASMTGCDSPVRVDLTIESTTEQQTSTDVLLAELNRIAAERPSLTLVTEGDPPAS